MTPPSASKALIWVRDLRIPKNDKLVLFSLVAHLPNIFPGIELIAQETGLEYAASSSKP